MKNIFIWFNNYIAVKKEWTQTLHINMDRSKINSWKKKTTIVTDVFGPYSFTLSKMLYEWNHTIHSLLPSFFHLAWYIWDLSILLQIAGVPFHCSYILPNFLLGYYVCNTALKNKVLGRLFQKKYLCDIVGIQQSSGLLDSESIGSLEQSYDKILHLFEALKSYFNSEEKTPKLK